MAKEIFQHLLRELELNGSDIQTILNKTFLFYDSGPDPDRIVMFGTRENLDFLETSNIWLADGTFKTVPALFAQLYTIHCLAGGPNPFVNGHLLPCVYALLPNKKSSIYAKMWKVIREARPNSQPNYLFLDLVLVLSNLLGH